MCLLAESVELQVDRGPEFGERRRERSIAHQPDAVRVEHNVMDALGSRERDELDDLRVDGRLAPESMRTSGSPSADTKASIPASTCSMLSEKLADDALSRRSRPDNQGCSSN